MSKYFSEKLSVFLALLFPPSLPLSLSFYVLFYLSLIGVDFWFGEQKAFFFGACSEVEIQARKKASYVSHLPDDVGLSSLKCICLQKSLNRSGVEC